MDSAAGLPGVGAGGVDGVLGRGCGSFEGVATVSMDSITGLKSSGLTTTGGAAMGACWDRTWSRFARRFASEGSVVPRGFGARQNRNIL